MRYTGDVLSVSPFAALGAGARRYNARHLAVDATHDMAASVGGGGDLRIGRVRLEARSCLTSFKPLDGDGRADTRRDVAVMAGLRYVRR